MKIEGNWWGRQSVKLIGNSELCNFIVDLREKIMPKFENLDVRYPHIEIYSKNEIVNNYDRESNFKELLNLQVDIQNIENYSLIGKAFVLYIGEIHGIMRHITIVFGVSKNDLPKLKELTQEVITIVK